MKSRIFKLMALLVIMLFFSACGGGGGGSITSSAISNSVDTSTSVVPVVDTGTQSEFTQWKSEVASLKPTEFVTWWNDSERHNGWTFSLYGQNGLVWPDSSGAEQIFTSKLLNCYRMTVLLQSVYGGESVYLYQPSSNYDHVVLLLYSNDENSYIMISYPNGGSPETCVYKILGTASRTEALSKVTSYFPGSSVASRSERMRF
ncbi:MAG: hypothetical protein ABRQ38_18775 [Candidatus Eremiobacterota bacterium]